MSERKVLNKYYPPNFDPAKIPRVKRPKDARPKHKVRLMAPFSMQCQTCGEYIYKGKKFNANKETVSGEFYYSIKIFRFYIRCPKCHAEITFKTDPGNLDYVAESGAVRNFEPWRDTEVVDDLVRLQRKHEEELNPIKALENKTIDSKREMEIMNQIDELRMKSDRVHGVDVDQVLQRLLDQDQIDEEAELDKLAKQAFDSNKEAAVASDDEQVQEVDLDQLMQQYREKSSNPSSTSSNIKRKNAWSSLIVKRPKTSGQEPGNGSSCENDRSTAPSKPPPKGLVPSYESDED